MDQELEKNKKLYFSKVFGIMLKKIENPNYIPDNWKRKFSYLKHLSQ